MRPTLVLNFGWAALLVLAACDETRSAPKAGASNPEKPGQAQQPRHPEKKAEPEGKRMTLVPLTVQDPMINNMEAFTILVPKGWRNRAEVQWRHNTSNLVSASVILSNPANGDQLQVFPIIPYAWIPNAVVPMAIGTNYMGAEIRPPMDPASIIRQLALPFFRGRVRGLQVVEAKPLPEVAREVHKSYYNMDGNTRIEAVKLTVSYEEDGREYEEALFSAASYAGNPMLPGAVFWKPEYVYAFRALKGGLPAAEGLLQAVVSSVTLDKKWFAQYLYVVQLRNNGQMQAIRSAGELSRYISGVNSEINDMITGSYDNAQRSQDRIYDSFSESVRGVETYDNPVTGRQVQLPSDYRNAWVSSNGEYFLSEGEADPNVGSSATWQRMNASR